MISQRTLASRSLRNGREGVLRGRDPNNAERFGVSVRSDDNTGHWTISVRSANYEPIQRPKLFNAEFV